MTKNLAHKLIDSHLASGKAIGMLVIGAGGLDVAMAMAGEPYHLVMPAIWGVELVGKLPAWTSAKDIILEMLRRHGVSGGVGRIIEYHGEGLEHLSAMDRHVIANMGAELGATATVFPSDDAVKDFLTRQQRQADWVSLAADPGAVYDVTESIDLSTIVPLIAMPSSPGNVRPVSEVAGQSISQAYIGSSANPGYRDFAIAAAIVAGKTVVDGVSFDESYAARARAHGDHAVVGGKNYGQGSSREHAAFAPRFLGLRVVIARSFARIHRNNLINFGVLPLAFCDPSDRDKLKAGAVIRIANLIDQLQGEQVVVTVADREIMTTHHLTANERTIVTAGGLINHMRTKLAEEPC